MPDYQHKLYAFLRSLHPDRDDPVESSLCEQLNCLRQNLPELRNWWAQHGKHYQDIASSSDRVNLHATQPEGDRRAIRHPISGEQGTVDPLPSVLEASSIPETILNETDPKKVFWWFWRFYPERWLNPQPEALSDGLLYPAHRVLPDCSLHSYQATVSALAGAIAPKEDLQHPENTRPYLLIFTFSPVQDFIKASRKFLDFWAGSYMLHYLSAHLCWHIADAYGPDALIVPSLWGQDIIDARLLEHYREADPSFYAVLEQSFKEIGDRKTPVERFTDRSSSSLSTAGFPNVITAIVPGLSEAKSLGEKLSEKLQEKWSEIGTQVQLHIRNKVGQEAATLLNDERKWDAFWQEVKVGLPNNESSEPYRSDLRKWRSQSNQHGQPIYPNWEWCALWNQQLSNTWEPYWAAVPLGDPRQPITVTKQDEKFGTVWKNAQTTLSKAWQAIPSSAEEHAFDTLNVGTWWGSFQQRLRMAIQSVKNTRVWHIPAAPGERSTLSGQYSAVHPNLNYRVVQRRGAAQDFREGGGLPEGTMRLFWLLMAKAYPGLFNGSERLNALELTKRMAWNYGGVAESLGIPTEHEEELDYDSLVRFPNLSSIAAARFVATCPELAQDYWYRLKTLVERKFEGETRKAFYSRTKRSFNIHGTDKSLRHALQGNSEFKNGLNGVMFSSRWLADDMGLQNQEELKTLRSLVEQAHSRTESFPGFGEGSPSDWWAIVLADGDGMGQYISGSKLEMYEKYLVDVDTSCFSDEIATSYRQLREKTRKRMGPATHIGLNRALLDFSNRLVPYLTEKRFCGKVIYSGGDDVMAVLPIEDVPEYLRSLRAAWSGTADPKGEFDHGDGYWRPKPGSELEGIPNRPLFTMGNTATLSMGVVIAHKSVPLPTVLDNLWVAESDRAKEMVGKDGICFRVIYSGGNTLEALMKGHLLDQWWQIAQHYDEKLGPMLHRLAEELPKRADVEHPALFGLAAQVLLQRRDEARQMEDIEPPMLDWLNDWGHWAQAAARTAPDKPGSSPEALGYLLRFTAFWVDKMVQRQGWRHRAEEPASIESTAVGER